MSAVESEAGLGLQTHIGPATLRACCLVVPQAVLAALRVAAACEPVALDAAQPGKRPWSGMQLQPSHM